MSEVWSLSRQCYRVFARCCPHRVRRLYQAFDPVTQRVIIDKHGGILKKYRHSTTHDTHQLRQSTSLPILGAGLSTSSSGQFNSSNGPHTVSMNGYYINCTLRPASSISQRKLSESAPERSLLGVSQANQQQANAI